MKKVVQMTSVHVPFDTRIFQKECRTLAAAGYEVVLLAPHERTETVGGVRVRGLRARKGRLGRMALRPIEIYRMAREEDADVYHFHDPELLPVGWLLSTKGRPVVWDTHEDHPRQLLAKDWLPAVVRPVLSRMVGLVEHLLESRFAAVVSAEPLAATRFKRGDVTVIQNWPILGAAPSGAPYSEREPIVAYVGTINRHRGLLEMVRAVNLLPPELGARLELAGPVQLSELRREAVTLDQGQRVHWLGYQKQPQVQELLSRARAGLVLLHPTDQYVKSQPVKLMEYMAAGIPFVSSDFPFWRRLAGTDEVGFFVDPLDPSAAAEALTWILEHPAEAGAMGARGRRHAERTLSWQSEGAKLLMLYDGLVSSRADEAAGAA